MELISMTDFVLEQIGDNLKYAQFLKQPLNLGMFVPCTLEGDVLEEPCSIGVGNDFYLQRAEDEYKQAKDRVLFEGFEVRDKWLIHNKHTYTSIDSFDTIEDIVNFGLELMLTKSAQKQLGL